DVRTIYLKKWFQIETLKKLETLRTIIYESANIKFINLFLALVSDLVREYSLQEPADLRIRRRTSEMPTTDFWDAVKIKVSSFCANINSICNIEVDYSVNSEAINIDIRDSKSLKG
ncbi:hypothetical protein, partial [Enterococcus faecalis]